jgi:hypothetical protein
VEEEEVAVVAKYNIEEGCHIVEFGKWYKRAADVDPVQQ